MTERDYDSKMFLMTDDNVDSFVLPALHAMKTYEEVEEYRQALKTDLDKGIFELQLQVGRGEFSEKVGAYRKLMEYDEERELTEADFGLMYYTLFTEGRNYYTTLVEIRSMKQEMGKSEKLDKEFELLKREVDLISKKYLEVLEENTRLKSTGMTRVHETVEKASIIALQFRKNKEGEIPNAGYTADFVLGAIGIAGADPEKLTSGQLSAIYDLAGGIGRRKGQDASRLRAKRKAEKALEDGQQKLPGDEK